jgi:hypothetical protein
MGLSLSSYYFYFRSLQQNKLAISSTKDKHGECSVRFAFSISLLWSGPGLPENGGMARKTGKLKDN